MWFIIFTVLPVVGFAYIFWRTWHILPLPLAGKLAVMAVMLLFIVIFFGNFSFFNIDKMPMDVAITSYETGNSTVFIALYVAMIFIVLDLGCLLRIIPKEFMNHSWAGTLTVIGIVAILFIYGYNHYLDKEPVHIDIKAQKALKKPLKVVMVSDLHVGYHNRKAELERWIDIINNENPDLVLICGDIIDGSIRAIRDQKMDEDFRRIKAPVYASLGNHEYYAGRAESIKFYHDAGINLLVDSAANIGELTIIGRDDRSNTNRKSIDELIKANGGKHGFTILMDHQPYHLEEAQKAGIDFQLSGHTHYGQVWPISWIEDAIYEDAFGPLTKGSTQYYVSSGLGIWGGKFRIGTRSEYVIATIH